ncbi:MAG: Chaperone protein DnaJ [candidate division WS2 bacterium]|uniref:Chaperone protein DnaJ n=1 Tax=Psychracetigena formicireducens TaxID=2986056 RepID=A0A9E2BJ72_PSYF1|nr:Chaperone protein DnaJ [Candidatus Psychracetigena formicireducens]MBT9151320.1 Chaperone protein DnaJ [Candidatus Psychracetigena formicireducens]
MAIGKYIYGIINSNTRESAGPYGISSCKEAHFIPYQDIAAVVADSEIIDYTHMFKDALARGLVEHQKVIERIMGIGYSIIPMRLGTFAMDEAEVKDILSKGYGLIKDIIPKISDKIEVDVVCIWSNFTSVVKEAGKEKEIKEYKEKLLNSHKVITVDDQMKIGFMLKKVLDEKREKYALKTQEALKAVSIGSKTHELMDDKMVANFAFLIDKDKQKEFYARLEDLNTEFKELLNFRCVGPLPAYSFFTLEIKKMQFNDVAWARKKLGIINDPVAKDEIKKAFHKQVFIFHPDKNPNKPGIEKEYDEIVRSYNILLDYAQSCERVGKANLYFNEDEFRKNAVLVKVRE